MLLILPVVSSELGPAWATEINQAFTQVDSHDHTSNKGVQIPSAGININSDLTFATFNATNLRSTRYVNQGSPLAGGSDINCVYFSGGNLYVNNNSGQQVQITAGAALNAASIGGIGGDYITSGASEFYTNATKTFSFTQSANTSASLDGGSVTIRENVASAKGITLKSPTSLAADFNMQLPAAQALSSNSFIVTSTAGVQSYVTVDGTSLTISTATLGVPNGGITQAKLQSRTAAQTAGAGGIAISSSCGAFTAAGTTANLTITNFSINLTTTGRPVMLMICPTTGHQNAMTFASASTSGNVQILMFKDSGGGLTNRFTWLIQVQEANRTGSWPATLSYLDMQQNGVASTVTYSFQVANSANTDTFTLNECVLIAYEI